MQSNISQNVEWVGRTALLALSRRQHHENGDLPHTARPRKFGSLRGFNGVQLRPKLC